MFIVSFVPRSWALAAVAALALASTAGAASWSPAVTVGETAAAASDPTITVAGHGSVLMGAHFVDEAGPFGLGDLRLFFGRHTTTYTEVGRFSEQFHAVRAYGARRAILVLGRVLRTDRDHNPVTRLTYRIGTASGRFGTARTLWTGRLEGDPVVAASSDGDIAIAWVEDRGEFGNERRLWLARRSRNAPFHRPAVLVGSGNASAPSLAWDFRGNLLVAFARQFRAHGRTVRDVAVRVRRAGHRFGPVRSLGPSLGDAEIATSIAATDQMYVAWGTQDGGEEANHPWRVYAASAIGPAHRFAEAQTLDPGGAIERPAGHVRLVTGNDGSAVVGWSSIGRAASVGFAYPARVASADAHGHFSAAEQLSPSAAMADLAIGPDGVVLAVLSTLPHGDYQQGEQVVAALRPAGAAQFSALEPVSPVERALEARGAFDPTTGRPTVVWVGQPGAGPFGPPYTKYPEALRASTRQ